VNNSHRSLIAVCWCSYLAMRGMGAVWLQCFNLHFGLKKHCMTTQTNYPRRWAEQPRVRRRPISTHGQNITRQGTGFRQPHALRYVYETAETVYLAIMVVHIEQKNSRVIGSHESIREALRWSPMLPEKSLIHGRQTFIISLAALSEKTNLEWGYMGGSLHYCRKRWFRTQCTQLIGTRQLKMTCNIG